MAQPLNVKHLLATGKQFTESSRSQARQLGTDLVMQGRLATEQISAVVDELTSRGGRERIEELRQTVRDEIQHELMTLRDLIRVDLAKGQVAVDRIVAMVNEQASERREHAEELREAVRDEVQRQLSTLGLATGEDLAALVRSIRDDLTTLESRLERRVASSTSGSQDTIREASVQVTPPHQHPPTT